MSVYFAKYCENGYGDTVSGVDPHMRDRLLSAIKELAVLGPGQPIPNLIPRIKKTHSKPRSIDGSRPRRGADHHRAHRAHRSHPGSPKVSFNRLTPEGVLKERLKRSMSLKLEKGNIKVYSNILHPDVEFKTLCITSQTTSKELISSILKKNNANDKDPNLYYVAMETGIKSKDSGLPISKMIVLDDDARPLELQACQPEGETKFHLKIKSGGLVRIRTNILCPQSSDKTVYIARNTTARQLIELIINGSGTDEKPKHFILREASADFAVDRILQDNEYPLEIQTRWKPNEGRLFFLTRLNKKSHASPVHSLPNTPEELKHEIAKQNQTIDTLNETIHRLQLENNITTATTSYDTLNSFNCQDNRNDYDGIDDVDGTLSKPVQHESVNDRQLKDGLTQLDNSKLLKTSIDALDLHNVPPENEINSKSQRCPSSQMNKLRLSFDRFRKKSSDDMEICDKNTQSKEIESRRRSQIERFRYKFLQYHNEKSILRKSSNPLTKRPVTRSWSTSDTEYYASVATNYPDLKELETSLSRTQSVNSSCDKEIRQILENKQQQQQSSKGWSLFDAINESDLIAVTLKRETGKELGLELAHVTQTGSSINEPSDVMYVYHNRDGNTSIVESPVTSGGQSPNIDYENDVDDVFADSSDNSHVCFGGQNDIAFKTDSQDESTKSNSPSSDQSNESGYPWSCCMLGKWRDGTGPKPHYGVRIVGITTGSIAEQTHKLHKDDIIVEVNGVNVLNSNLDVVIETLRNHTTVMLVVARKKEIAHDDVMTEETPSCSPPVLSNHDDTQALTEQVQQLLAKVTDMQESLTKKDRNIAHLKKSLMKRKLKMTSNEKIVEGVQVIV